MTLETNRLLGGIGAILLVAASVSQFSSLAQFFIPQSIWAVFGSFGFLALIGFILFVIAMYGFSKDYGASAIFENVLYGIVLSIVAAVVAGVFTAIIILVNFNQFFPSLSQLTSAVFIQSSILRLVLLVLPAIAIASLFQALFNKRAFDLLADKSKVTLFRLAGKLMLIGASLTIASSLATAVIVFLITVELGAFLAIVIGGGVVGYVAWLLAAIAFFRMPPPPASIPPSPVQSAPTATAQVKYCTQCGTENLNDATYCRNCGKKL